jgi:phasin
MNTKKPGSSTNVREMTETSAQQSQEVLEKIGTATSEAAEVMTTCCSTALKGMQDYHSKLTEFTQANAKAHVEFLQKLAGSKSPTEWLELSASHTRSQLDRLADQGKQLTELTKQVTLATVEPVKIGLAKVYDRAA